MFTVKIAPNSCCYEYMCPYCGGKQQWIGSFMCPECNEFLELYVEAVDSDVRERYSYHSGATY